MSSLVLFSDRIDSRLGKTSCCIRPIIGMTLCIKVRSFVSVALRKVGRSHSTFQAVDCVRLQEKELETYLPKEEQSTLFEPSSKTLRFFSEPRVLAHSRKGNPFIMVLPRILFYLKPGCLWQVFLHYLEIIENSVNLQDAMYLFLYPKRS